MEIKWTGTTECMGFAMYEPGCTRPLAGPDTTGESREPDRHGNLLGRGPRPYVTVSNRGMPDSSRANESSVDAIAVRFLPSEFIDWVADMHV